MSVLELSFTNNVLESVTVAPSQCIESFRPPPTTNIQELTIHSNRWLRGQTSNPAHRLLQSLPALRKLVLNGCNEISFYKTLVRVRSEGRHGKRKLSVVCPHLAVVEINPIVEFRKHLGGQAASCIQLATDLSVLMWEREGRGAPLKRLNIVFPAKCEKEARYVEKGGGGWFGCVCGSRERCVNRSFGHWTPFSLRSL